MIQIKIVPPIEWPMRMTTFVSVPAGDPAHSDRCRRRARLARQPHQPRRRVSRRGVRPFSFSQSLRGAEAGEDFDDKAPESCPWSAACPTRNLRPQNRFASDQMQQHDQQHERNHREQIGAGSRKQRIVERGPGRDALGEIAHDPRHEGDHDAGDGAAGDVAGCEQYARASASAVLPSALCAHASAARTGRRASARCRP